MPVRRNALALRAVDALRVLAVPSGLGVSASVDVGVVVAGVVGSEGLEVVDRRFKVKSMC